MTVMSSLATLSPIRPEYTERPFRLRSASSPWPTDSWMSVPPASLARTTVYVPAGAGSAATFCTASRAAVSVVSRTASSVSISKPSVPAFAL